MTTKDLIQESLKKPSICHWNKLYFIFEYFICIHIKCLEDIVRVQNEEFLEREPEEPEEPVKEPVKEPERLLEKPVKEPERLLEKTEE